MYVGRWQCEKKRRPLISSTRQHTARAEWRDVWRLIAKGKATIYCRSSNYKPTSKPWGRQEVQAVVVVEITQPISSRATKRENSSNFTRSRSGWFKEGSNLIKVIIINRREIYCSQSAAGPQMCWDASYGQATYTYYHSCSSDVCRYLILTQFPVSEGKGTGGGG